MLYQAVHYIANDLNTFIVNREQGGTASRVRIGHLANPDGSTPEYSDNVILSVAHIAEERIRQAPKNYRTAENGRFEFVNPPVHLNFYLLCTAWFTEHTESLKYVSQVIAFFQHKPVFNHQNSPGLDPNIVELCLKIENMNMHDHQNLWGLMGPKYLPSVYYKIQMVSISENATDRQVSTVESIETHLQTR
ncbi:MAG: DUF4255 domain-containing protein [Bacteroidota bacterium]